MKLTWYEHSSFMFSISCGEGWCACWSHNIRSIVWYEIFDDATPIVVPGSPMHHSTEFGYEDDEIFSLPVVQSHTHGESCELVGNQNFQLSFQTCPFDSSLKL